MRTREPHALGVVVVQYLPSCFGSFSAGADECMSQQATQVPAARCARVRE